MTIPAELAFQIAITHHRTGHFGAAEAMCRQILAAEPNRTEVLHRLGMIAFDTKHFREAEELVTRAIGLASDHADWFSDLGMVYHALGRTDEAVSCYGRALLLDSAPAHFHYNLGNTLQSLGRFAEAVASYRRAIERLPTYASAHANLAIQLLLLGQYEEGWRELEWRWRSPDSTSPRRAFAAREWTGAPMPGQTLLLHADQGYGDTIQFLRYVPQVKERSGAERVILECQPELWRLLTQTGGWNAEVLARPNWQAAHLPPFEAHLSTASLPLALGQFAPRPMAEPYLRADPELRAVWRERLGPRERLRVGIAWAGSATNRQDERRSIPLEQMLRFLPTGGVTFFSLQVERSDSPSALAVAGVIDLTGQISDFADTAAFVAELDLVISVDTALAHLAGALGQRVWTLLPFVPDWRWGLESENTPWYPSMRLFRQTVAGDWDSVLRRVVASHFRKDLLDGGYLMIQFSIYARPCVSYEQMDTHIARVKAITPEAGNVRLMFITDEQWGKSVTVAGPNYQQGNRAVDPQMPAQVEFWE